jgi:hypothetical protein
MALYGLGQDAQRRGDWDQATALHRESLEMRVEQGAKQGMVASLDGLAGVALGQGRPDRTARLMGAAEALLAALGASLPPGERDDHDRRVVDLRAALGEEAFAAAWAEGRAMSIEQAVEYGLEERAED